MAFALVAFLVAIQEPMFAAGAGVRLRASVSDCPLCVAEDRCHVACSEIRNVSPGSAYCLNACTGGHPGDNFGEAWFARKDAETREARERDAELQQIGKELAEETATADR
eukprot:TRINITY_DN5319_c0_g1_i1.p1 TRINITY_DN5319_c0_g1~~TRINITY_DN5319_c0_g1_i1.p1  ORF type:complete len:110 (+),score=24.92 TRINITY_DN5319_c0_g1_i1:109-438(+)